MNPGPTPNRSARQRRRAGMAAIVSTMTLLACGGGGDAEPAPPASVSSTPASGRLSSDELVRTGCTGGGSRGGTLYANAEVEPTLALAPGDPRRRLAAWQQDRWSDGGARALVSMASTDGGANWVRTLHPLSRCGGAGAGSSGDFERASDPWVGVGGDGTLHLMGLAFSGTAFGVGSRSAMLATRSTDGGRSWSEPQTLVVDGSTLFNDKNTLTVDALDPRYVYAVWDRLEPSGNGPTLLARSSDAGQSWEPAREIYRPAVPNGGTAQTIGNLIVVVPSGPHQGTLVNVFTQIDVGVGGNPRNTVRVVRSQDQGLTWSGPVTVAEHRGVGTTDAASGNRVRDGAIVPSAAAGPDGTLWVAWQDSRFFAGQRDAIAVSHSTDGGASWSTPVAASGAAAAFTPTLHVRADGLVGLLYFDLRPDTGDPATLLAAAWLATSRDGMAWADTEVWGRFDLAQAPDARGLFLGDYMGLASVGDAFLPLVVLSKADPANRTDVYLLPVTPRAGAARQAPPVAGDEQAFEARRRAFTQRVMERRVPDWGRRVGLARDALR